MSLNFLHFLITYEFWHKLGFLISYAITSLLVLEVLRLVYTDVNKREVEKMLDSYSKARSEPRQETRKRIPIDDLDKRPQTPHPRISSPAVSPDSERTLINEERRRRRAQLPASQQPVTVTVTQLQAHAQTATPTRRLRKRSDTLNSSSSAESRKLDRRRREASPASLADSKASSRNGSPKPPRKVRDKEAQQLGSSLHKALRQRA